MKKYIAFLILTWCFCTGLQAQTYNSAYVKALYGKYPAVKSNLCPNCMLWVNPYYRSIADVKEHRPVVEYEYFTKENAALADKLNIPRGAPKKGAKVAPGAMKYCSVFSDWSALPGQPNEDGVYTAANVAVKAKNKADEIAKGHVQAWILNAFAIDAVILSDTYTFNAGCEDQKQNVGTEIASENITRKLLESRNVEVWGGTYGNQGTFTDGKVTDVYPAFYWKIIKANGAVTCYWMPNLITEVEAMLPKRIVPYAQLVKNIGFDPLKIFPAK